MAKSLYTINIFMKKIIGGVFTVLLILSVFNIDKVSAYLFYSPTQICQTGRNAGNVKCLSYPTPSQCSSIGGNGTVLDTVMGCYDTCSSVEANSDSVGYCDQTATPSCPANCPGTYPSCAPNSGYSYNSSNNTCNAVITPYGTLTANNNGTCDTTPGGTCTVTINYTTNNGVTNASIWKCDRDKTNCSSVVSSIPGNANSSQNITVTTYNSASAGSYLKLVNGSSEGSPILKITGSPTYDAELYAVGIPQQSYTCSPSGPTYNRYQFSRCTSQKNLALTSCPNGTYRPGYASGDTSAVGETTVSGDPNGCKYFDFSVCQCNSSVTCGDGSSGTFPSCTCPGGKIFNSGTNTCACPAGQTWDGGTSTCRTTCPSGSTGTYSPSCTCPSPASYNSGSNTCTCPAPRVWNGSSCACPSGQVWDGSTCQIPCPSGTTGTYHPSCTCPAPRTYNTTSRTCECPVGQTWNGTSCVTPATRCDDPLYNMYIEYSAVTSSGFNVAWDCGTLKGTGSTYIWGPDQSGWTGALETGNYTSSGKSPSTTYGTSLWCGYPYGQSMNCDVTTSALAPITVTTNAATGVTTGGATLAFTVSNYNSTPVSGAVKLYQSDGTTVINTYSTTNPGSTVNANGAYSVVLSSLSCGTTYQFRGEAGSTYGSKLSFTTSACPSLGVTWTNLPKSVQYGQTTALKYNVTGIPGGQTATCDLYDYTGTTEISGVSAQTLTGTTPTVGNASFEAPVLGASSGQWNPAGATWTFTGSTSGTNPPAGSDTGTGIMRDGWNGWSTPNENGSQYAFIRGNSGSISQSVTFGGGTYQISVMAARAGASSMNDLVVQVDGNTVMAVPYASMPAGTFSTFTTYNIDLAAGSHTISLTGGTSSAQTLFLDNVTIAPAASHNGTFNINPSPATLPVNPSGYGYTVKCTIPTPASTIQALGNVNVVVDGTPSVSMERNPTPTLMRYQCSNSTGVKIVSTGGRTQSLSGGQYVYAATTTPQTALDQYLVRFKTDYQNNALSGQTNNAVNFPWDRNNSGAINATDLAYINARLTYPTITSADLVTVSGSAGSAMATGPDGYIYVSGGTTIQKMNPADGSRTTFASGFNNAKGVAFGPDGVLYVADLGNGNVYKVSTGGVVTTLSSGFTQPLHLVVDSSSNVYMANNVNNEITKIFPNGSVAWFASIPNTGSLGINGMTISPVNNYLYVLPKSSVVYQVTTAGSVTSLMTMADPGFGIVTDTSNNMYVSSYSAGTVTRINVGGSSTSTVMTGLSGPMGMAIAPTGEMFIGRLSGMIRKSDVLDSYPRTLTGTFSFIQGAQYAIECLGAYGTLPAYATSTPMDMTTAYASSTAALPNVLATCPTNSTAYTITRSPIWKSSPVWSSGSIWGATNTDSEITLGAATSTYTYTLTCTRNNGLVYTGQLVNSVNVPPAIVVNNMNSPMVASGTPAVINWRSDGNSCDLKNFDGSATWAGGITGTPISGGYQYSYTMSPNNPNFTWLNSSRIGANAIGWSVSCKDTNAASRLSTTNSSTVQVYVPTTATITPPDVNGNLRFTCTRDFDYMDIKRNGISMSGYPKTWNINQTSSYSILLPNLGGIYELVCKSSNIPGNIDNDIYPDAGLQVYGSIGGNTPSSIPTTAVVTGTTAQTGSMTNDGMFANLSYNIANATTWTVEFYDAAFSGGTLKYSCTNAGGCDSNYSMYRLTSGTSNVSLYSSVGLPDIPLNNGGRWVITASDGVSTKTLTLSLSNTVVPTGSLVAVPNPLAGTDFYDLYISCDNSISYNLYNTTFATTTSDGLIVAYNSLTYNGSMTNKITYKATSSTGASSMSYRFECIGASQAYVQAGSLPILSRQPATVNKFTVYPQTVVCGGGKVALAWTVNNPVGKNCTLDATTTKPLSQYPGSQQSGIATGISSVRAKLNSSDYVVRGVGAAGTTNTQSGMSTSSAFSTLDVNGNSVGELPRIQIRDNTRFSLSCVHQGVTTTVSIDARTACQGEQ